MVGQIRLSGAIGIHLVDFKVATLAFPEGDLPGDLQIGVSEKDRSG
jgi:hypothetical protein